jgi:multiple sugar transport system substrate-binding protein
MKRNTLKAFPLIGLLAMTACAAPTAPVTPAAPPAPQATAEQKPAEPTAAPAAAGEKVTLNLWIFEGEESFLPELKKQFEAKYPNITLEITEIPEDQYVTKIDTALAAGAPPDIGFVYGGINRWLKAGKFLSLDEMVKDKGIQLENYNPGAMSLYCLYEGKVYCLGSYTGAVLLFYNKDLFDQAGVAYPSATEPMTVEDYVALAAKLSKPDPDLSKRIWGGSSPGTPFWFMDWTTHYGEDGRKAAGFVNDADTVRTYELFAKMVKDGSSPSAADMQAMGDADLLTQGRMAMAITDNFVAINNLEQAGIRYGAAAPPVEKKGDRPFVITWSDAFGVFSDSKHPKEAMEFIAFLAQEGNKLRITTGNALPLDMKVAEDANWAGQNEGRKESLQAIQLARPTIFVPGYYEISGPLGDAYDAIVDGQKSPQAALDEAAEAVQDSLDKQWETWEQIK